MWVAVEQENEDMLGDNYDSFVLVPVILGMYYGQDVRIEGNISPRLYHNMTHYMMNIFDRYSDFTRPVKFSAAGLKSVTPSEERLVGTGISCGVDSLLTIYDNFVMTKDPAFRLNALFFFNCGTHGDFENPASQRVFEERVALNRRAAEELELPMYLVRSNFHAFTHKIGEQKIGHLAIYSCALALQRYVRRYLASSCLSYDEIIFNRNNSRDFDFAEYCESFFCHLVSTEIFELVTDGCQYTRAEKTERIASWEIAQKYLNVCVQPVDGAHNCSKCSKCMRTLIPLEAMGKLEKFSGVFDLDVYHKNVWIWKNAFAASLGRDCMATGVMNYAKKKGMSVPSAISAKVVWFLYRAVRKVKRIVMGSK